MKRISFIIIASLLTGCISQSLTSPNRQLTPHIYVDSHKQLTYTLNKNGKTIIKPSKLGINIDGIQLGNEVECKQLSIKKQRGSFPWLGTSSTIPNNYTTATYEITHIKSPKRWLLETRCYDHGFAFRYIIKQKGKHKVITENTTWNIPKTAQLWYRRNGGSFQTYWQKQYANKIPKRFNAQLNVTIELADGSYASLNEAGSFDFSGGSLLFNGTNEINTIYAGNKKGWFIKGDIITPWRIVMVADDLNDLVNCNLTAAVCPAPDKKLFPKGVKTEWINPGRSLWQWWGYWNPGTEWNKQHWFIDNAAALGCDYYLVDEGWEHPRQGWITKTRTAWDALTELATYAKKRNIKLLVWRSYPARKKSYYAGLETVEKRRNFFKQCKKAGIYGAKIDFLNSEDVVHNTFMHDCLREAAQYHLLINFHGAPKPIGQERTYPNQVSREGLVGLEHNKWETIPRKHYATTPFTRFLAGYADFTVTTFQKDFIKGTTCTLQLAQAIVYTSPALHWADKPQYYLNSPAVDLIRSVPTTWDETIVLPSSKIGVQAAYARRKGKDWYVGIINGRDNEVNQTLNLSFLGKGEFITTCFKDIKGKPVQLAKEHLTCTNHDKLKIKMSPGGGFVAMFRKLDATPYGGGVYNYQITSLQAPKNAQIYYTLDGTVPTKNSNPYTQPITITKTCTLKAKILAGDGKGCQIKAKFCKLDLPAPIINGKPLIAHNETINILNLTKGKIYYTTDNSTPTQKSKLYKEPITITKTCTIKAINIYHGLTSKVASKKITTYPKIAPKARIKLSELKPIKATIDWGTIQRNRSVTGKPLKLGNKIFTNGIGTHANSSLVYKLKKNYTHFVAGVGIATGKAGSAQFIIKIDDKTVEKSPVIQGNNIWYFNIKIPKGAKIIELLSLDGGNGITDDHVNWVDAGFLETHQ